MTGNSGYFVLGGSRGCSIKGVVPAVLVIMDYRNWSEAIKIETKNLYDY